MPLSDSAAAATAHGRQRYHGLPSVIRWQVRPVRRRSVSRVCALLLRGADGRGDLPVALRAEKRAISARRLSKPPTPANDLFQAETDDPPGRRPAQFFQGRAVDQGRPSRRAPAVRRQQPRQGPRVGRFLWQEATAGAPDHPAEEPRAGGVAQIAGLRGGHCWKREAPGTGNARRGSLEGNSADPLMSSFA